MLKIRCSALGKIMTNSRSKSEVLSKTCKTYLEELAIEELYGIRKEYSNRYFDKGNEVERDSIDLAQEVLDKGFMYKNDESFSNDFITGTPDVNTDELLLEIKSSYDGSTFPFYAEKIPTKDYYYQLMGYMELTGKRDSLLAYCLINTPEQIIEDEIRREHWKQNEIDEKEEIRKYVEEKHNFDHIPKEKRIKIFNVDHDEQVMESIYIRIGECREYYKTLINEKE
tara:strand:- start:6311 stop:6988 length:678 start_codon:yes stop_codon:yes gene_type:complete